MPLDRARYLAGSFLHLFAQMSRRFLYLFQLQEYLQVVAKRGTPTDCIATMDHATLVLPILALRN